MKHPLFMIVLLAWITRPRPGTAESSFRLSRQKHLAFERQAQVLRQGWSQCSSNGPPGRPFEDSGAATSFKYVRAKQRREVTDGAAANSALYLEEAAGALNVDGDPKVPWRHFSVALWLKPQGGQPRESVVLEARDVCSPLTAKQWSLRIEASGRDDDRNGHFVFRLQAARSQETSVLRSPVVYAPGEWHHVAATFDGTYARLYINGAQVAITGEQKGYIFQKSGSSCRSLSIGGGRRSYYRGLVDRVRTWGRALSQVQVQHDLWHQDDPQGALFTDAFDSLDKWEWTGSPRLVQAPAAARPSGVRAQPVPCGFTVCDAPEVVLSYQEHWHLRTPKTLRYLVINVKNSDGSNPTVTEEQIQRQHAALNDAFSPYNITWDVTQASVLNSSLRRRQVTLGCQSHSLGDGVCNPDCQLVGNDGGDCDSNPEPCEPKLVGDGRCQRQCNQAAHAWDGGDCCLAGHEHGNCLDPASPERSYVEVKEYKDLLGFNNSFHVNVLFAEWTDRNIIGIATFPWEKEVFSVQGGVVVQPESFGRPGRLDTLVHEMGHVLGLWHVHRGVSEVECYDDCLETRASLDTGDLCEDTGPTPMNHQCHDPPADLAHCGLTNFVDTPFRNYMGYGDDACTSVFSQQQVARMHCYADLFYGSWQPGAGSSRIPEPPMAPVPVVSGPHSVTLSWAPSVASVQKDQCSLCTETRALSQYAIRATDGANHRDAWEPRQATGPPDADVCTLSYRAWLPAADTCNDRRDCTLTLELETPVVPAALSLWMPWNSREGLSELVLVYADQSEHIMKDITAYCDMPYTMQLDTDKELVKIVAVAASPMVALDSVQVVSLANHASCASCKPLRYRVFREPPFSTADSRLADGLHFTDVELEPDGEYRYQVQAWMGNRVSNMSPVLRYVHGQGYCGDGKLDANEECDDGNTSPGDGCGGKCNFENKFKCKGSPSLCYAHEDDGICEPSEEHFNTRDCGFFTPPGFFDQWASSVVVSEDAVSHRCRPEALLGPPPKKQVCSSDLNTTHSWYPCEAPDASSTVLTASFERPVVATAVHVYIASDGGANISPLLTVELLPEPEDFTRTPHYVQSRRVSCKANPIEVNVMHDLSKSFHLTRSVRLTLATPDVSIGAIRLRSSNALNPVALSSCSSTQLYHPGLQKCVDYSCERPRCQKPLVKNARLMCQGLGEGDVCKLLCDEGYALAEGEGDHGLLVCDDGQWRGSGTLCKPVDCKMPVIAHADPMCAEGTTFGKTCSFKCRPPARFKGGISGLASISCQKDGRWSEPEHQCHVACPAPSAPPHAVMTNCRGAEPLLFGHKCRFHCKAGYHVKGHANKKRSFHLVCSETGAWSGPGCSPVSCPALPPVYTGLYACTDAWYAGSVCAFACPGAASKSELKCELDGVWNRGPPQCAFANLHCPLPKDVADKVQFRCADTRVGSVCHVTCRQPDHEPVVSLDGRQLPLGGNITCAGIGLWHPDPERLQCRQKCHTEYIGDGWCDAANNQEHCGWDGGDCCSSTVPGRFVRTFPPNCSQECACRDPDAQ